MANPYSNKPASPQNVRKYLSYEGVPISTARELVSKHASAIEISESAESDTFFVADRILLAACEDDKFEGWVA